MHVEIDFSEYAFTLGKIDMSVYACFIHNLVFLVYLDGSVGSSGIMYIHIVVSPSAPSMSRLLILKPCVHGIFPLSFTTHPCPPRSLVSRTLTVLGHSEECYPMLGAPLGVASLALCLVIQSLFLASPYVDPWGSMSSTLLVLDPFFHPWPSTGTLPFSLFSSCLIFV